MAKRKKRDALLIDQTQAGDKSGTPWVLDVSWPRPPSDEEVILGLAPSFLGREGPAVEFTFRSLGKESISSGTSGKSMEQFLGMWLASRVDHWYQSTDKDFDVVRMTLNVEFMNEGS